MRTRILLACIAVLMVLAAGGCASAPERAEQPPAQPPEPTGGVAVPDTSPVQPEPSASEIAWLDTPLTDSVTGREFRLADYKGKPVLLHAFAVW